MRLCFKRSAEKELLRLDKELAKRILVKLSSLSEDPYGLNSEKLAGNLGYRIRVGEYRIVYSINKGKKELTIVRIGHRRDIYRQIK